MFHQSGGSTEHLDPTVGAFTSDLFIFLSNLNHFLDSYFVISFTHSILDHFFGLYFIQNFHYGLCHFFSNLDHILDSYFLITSTHSMGRDFHYLLSVDWSTGYFSWC